LKIVNGEDRRRERLLTIPAAISRFNGNLSAVLSLRSATGFADSYPKGFEFWVYLYLIITLKPAHGRLRRDSIAYDGT